MPSTPEKRREQQRLYRQSPAGRASAKRSKAKYIAQRRAKRQADKQELTINPAPLMQALTSWSTQ
jgi:hypothetical protein